ncbi:hypothetical protein ACFL3T_03215, partial [Patescibacteria group bacterium]
MKLKELLQILVGGAIIGLVCVLSTIGLFWAQDMYVDIDGRVLDWSSMGYPLGYGALSGVALMLVLAVIVVILRSRADVQYDRDVILVNAAARDVEAANAMIRDLNLQVDRQAENLNLEQASNQQLRREIDGLRTELLGVHTRADQLESERDIAK